MAAAGMMLTYGPTLRGEDIMFFIDHQSVCCALVKGCGRSWDIQLLATCWQLVCLQMGCRVWIEWVPSESNPADILSREGLSLFPTASGEIDKLRLPPWTHVSNKDLKKSLRRHLKDQRKSLSLQTHGMNSLASPLLPGTTADSSSRISLLRED